MTLRIAGILLLTLTITASTHPAPATKRQSPTLIDKVSANTAVPSRLFRRRAAVPQPATMVYKYAFLREKPEDRVPDRICIVMDEKVQYGGCVDVARDQVDVVVEFVGPVDFRILRWYNMHGAHGTVRPLTAEPANMPNPF